MLDKRLVLSPQFLLLARKLLDISEEKVKLAEEFRDYCISHSERLQALNSRADRAVEEFNLLYKGNG